MDALIEKLEAKAELSAEEIEHAVERLTGTEASEESKAAFLLRLRSKGETAAEIAGFAQAMLRRAIDPEIDAASLPGPLVDLCGTGGDRSDLFNVSTTGMFVVAAAGGVVVKHGNRAVTSQCGGADVLEELGVKLELPPARLRECLARAGAGFLFAPAYHPAFKAIGPVRKRLAGEGLTTIFNILGPMLNPARPERQLVGIYAEELLSRYAQALARLGRQKAWVAHGHGLDELSLSGVNAIEEIGPGAQGRFSLDPADFGFARAELDELRGGNRARNAEILLGILRGEITGPMHDMVVLNSGAAIFVAGLAPDLPASFALAREVIESGRALERLEILRAVAK